MSSLVLRVMKDSGRPDAPDFFKRVAQRLGWDIVEPKDEKYPVTISFVNSNFQTKEEENKITDAVAGVVEGAKTIQYPWVYWFEQPKEET